MSKPRHEITYRVQEGSKEGNTQKACDERSSGCKVCDNREVTEEALSKRGRPQIPCHKTAQERGKERVRYNIPTNWVAVRAEISITS